MTRLIGLACIAFLLSACAGGPLHGALSRVPVVPDVPVVVPDVPPVQHSSARAAVADENHYMQPDDCFISQSGYGQQAWIWVQLAKMVTPPTPGTKSEAEFMKVTDGNRIWTKHYWKTSLAGPNDLKLGKTVIAFNDRGDGDGVYCAPETKEEARGGSWFMAKITDVSDLYKGYVTVSGNYKVSVKNLRVTDR